MRRDIDRNPERIKAILQKDSIRKSFLENASRQQSTVAFVASNKGNALKTKPKGFDADHPEIPLLRLRNYTIGKKLKDEELLGVGGLERIVELLSAIQPFVAHLNSVVRPDDPQEPDGEAGSESEEDKSDTVE